MAKKKWKEQILVGPWAEVKFGLRPLEMAEVEVTPEGGEVYHLRKGVTLKIGRDSVPTWKKSD